MKTKYNVNLKWRKCWGEEHPNSYEAVAGNYTCYVDGKRYTIHQYHKDLFYGIDSVKICSFKARSNKDALQRGTNRLIKLALSDTIPNLTYSLVKE